MPQFLLLLAQAETEASTAAATPELSGGYLSLVKILLIAFVFFLWVKLADWMNRDAVKLVEESEMSPKVWNPINVASFLIGFLVAISVPIFLIGYPLFVIAAFAPWLSYFLIRRGKMSDNSAMVHRAKAAHGDAPEMETLEQDLGAEVKFKAAGGTDTDRKANLIHARQSDGYPELKEIINDAMNRRADAVLIDYTRAAALPRIQVDGTWHKLDPFDRELGDAILVSIKYLAGLEPKERKRAQSGKFGAQSDASKVDVQVDSAGVKTGERVQLKFLRSRGEILPLTKLGMLPAIADRFLPALNEPGICIISAPAGQGLTASWQGMMMSSDRLTRDCLALIGPDEQETTLENIVPKPFDINGGPDQQPAVVLKNILLSQPNTIVFPEITDAETLDMLTNHAVNDELTVWLRCKANSATEALLRVYAKAGDRKQFAAAARFVTGQRLVRRLCDRCKQEVRVKPELIKQLGGNPAKQKTIFGSWKLPPPAERVDEKGQPIEFPPCRACGGIGYVGRVAIYELLEVNDAVREALIKTPKMELLQPAVAKSGGLTPMSQSAYRLILTGITSLPEVQNVLKK